MATRGFEHITPAELARIRGVAPTKPSKYRNVKVVINGETFDSKREAKHWQELKARQAAKQIEGLTRQVSFALMCPSQDRFSCVIVAKYVADFVYYELNGKRHVVDAKGKRTAMYELKKRWLFLQDGIEIEEV